ncbi:MAG: TolC family outer membrane protein [Pseudomonadota bacterium]
MRRIALVLPLLAAACTQHAAAPTSTGAAFMDRATRVDLQTADAALFLQSSHTGYIEAPPAHHAPAATVRAAPRRARPEMGDRGPGGSIFAAHRPRAPEPVPQITVRPVNVRPAAGTLRGAFEEAYESNPTLNQARANLRAADENIAIAKSGNRPTITANFETGVQHVREVNTLTSTGVDGNPIENRTPTQVALSVSQPLFRGFRTRNATRQAEANVRAERERVRATEQDVFLNTAIAFVDVRRFTASSGFRRQEVAFLQEQLSAARARQEFGEGTRTDIDQADARLAESRATLAADLSSLAQAKARFQELTGAEAVNLTRDIDVVRLLPENLGEALRVGASQNPNIHLAIHEVDAAQFNVKTLEGEALPTVTLNGNVQTDIDISDADRVESAEVSLVVAVPIYQAGRVSAQVRQAKEQLGGARIAVDAARDGVRSDLASAWATYQAALDTISAANRSVAAARRAVEGILEELRVGQRTTVDVLNAQADLIRAEITRVEGIRQRDGAAFVILRNMGTLDIATIGLSVKAYDPTTHYVATRDRWIGMRTPDGR